MDALQTAERNGNFASLIIRRESIEVKDRVIPSWRFLSSLIQERRSEQVDRTPTTTLGGPLEGLLNVPDRTD